MLKVLFANLPVFLYMPNCVLEDSFYKQILKVFNYCHCLIVICVEIVWIQWVLHQVPNKKIGQRRIWKSWKPKGLKSSDHKHIFKSAIDIWSVAKISLDSFIFCQLHNKRIQNIVRRWQSKRKKMGPICLHNIPFQTPILSSYSGNS